MFVSKCSIPMYYKHTETSLYVYVIKIYVTHNTRPRDLMIDCHIDLRKFQDILGIL